MGVEMEGQNSNQVQHIRTRETQKENMEKLEQVTDMVDGLNIDGIETDTKTIKNVVMENLENQANLDDISNTLNKVVQGITDIKRSQTNINKKINELQDKVGE